MKWWFFQAIGPDNKLIFQSKLARLSDAQGNKSWLELQQLYGNTHPGSKVCAQRHTDIDCNYYTRHNCGWEKLGCKEAKKAPVPPPPLPSATDLLSAFARQQIPKAGVNYSSAQQRQPSFSRPPLMVPRRRY